jgi:hypothetical protein
MARAMEQFVQEYPLPQRQQFHEENASPAEVEWIMAAL